MNRTVKAINRVNPTLAECTLADGGKYIVSGSTSQIVDEMLAKISKLGYIPVWSQVDTSNTALVANDPRRHRPKVLKDQPDAIFYPTLGYDPMVDPMYASDPTRPRPKVLMDAPGPNYDPIEHEEPMPRVALNWQTGEIELGGKPIVDTPVIRQSPPLLAHLNEEYGDPNAPDPEYQAPMMGHTTINWETGEIEFNGKPIQDAPAGQKGHSRPAQFYGPEGNLQLDYDPIEHEEPFVRPVMDFSRPSRK